MLALVLAACGAPEPEAERTITVIGEATLRRAPEVFFLEGRVSVRAETRDEALEQAGDTLNAMREALGDLRGLEKLAFNTDNFGVVEVLPYGCEPNFRGEERPQDCAPLAHIARIPFDVVGEPYQVAGDAASLLAERGATEVGVTGFGVAEPEALRAEARRQAVLEGLQTAQELAGGAGERLGPVIRLQQGLNHSYRLEGPELGALSPQELDVGSRLRSSPRNPVRLTPDEIEVTERVELVIGLVDVDLGG